MTRFAARHSRELSVAAAYGLLLATLAVLRPTFFHGRFAQTAVAAAPVLVAAVGMTLVVLARHIDVSVGAQVSVCAVAAAVAARAGWPMPLVVTAAVAVGAAMGAVNGGLVAGLGLPSVVVTLATAAVLQQSLRWAVQGQSVHDLPATFQWFGHSQRAGRAGVVAAAVAVWAAAAWATRYLSAGRAVYAVGSDAEAARLAGARPGRIVFAVFTLTGGLAGLAAVLGAVRFAQVDPNVGLGLELQVIAAVVVGGTAVGGGRGTLFGTLAGVLLLGTVGAALGSLTDQAHWDRAVQGAVILAAVASDGLSRRTAAAPAVAA